MLNTLLCQQETKIHQEKIVFEVEVKNLYLCLGESSFPILTPIKIRLIEYQ